MGLVLLITGRACRMHWLDFAPPSQSDEAAAGNVFEVVEVGREEEDCDDEDEHKVICEIEAEEVDEERGYDKKQAVRSKGFAELRQGEALTSSEAEED